MSIGTPVIPTNGTGSSATAAASYTTGSIDFTNGRAKILCVMTKAASAVAAPTSVTSATALGNVSSSSGTYNFSWWSLPVNQADGALTIAYAASVTACAWSLVEVPNVDTSAAIPQSATPITSASSGSKTVTLTQTGAGNAILTCYCINNGSETYTLTGDLVLVDDTAFSTIGRTVWSVDTSGGTAESITAASTAIKGMASFEIADAPGVAGSYGDTLVTSLNRLAKTSGLSAQGAANAWAGTNGLALVGALNSKAGNVAPAFKALDGVCNQIAGTSGLSADDALRRVIG